MVSPLVVLLCLFLAHLVYTKAVEILIARRFARTRGCKKLKSAPQKDPFLGIDIFLETRIAVKEKKFLEYLVDRFTHVGPTFASNIMGDNLIFTNEPKNIQAMLATNFKDFDLGERRRQNWAKLLGEYGIFNADGAFWEHSRALVRPNFNRKQVADLRIFESHIQKLVSQLPGDGSSVNIQEYLFRLTLDTATEFLFGESIDSLRPDASATARKFASAFNYSMRSIAQRIRLGRFNWLYQDTKYNQACRDVHEYIDPIIKKAISYRQSHHAPPVSDDKAAHADGNLDERYVFLHELAKETGNESELRDQVLNILIAGRDTTASLLSSLLFVLAHRQDILSKVRNQIAFLQGRAPTFEDIKDMKYIKFVINEALRLYPPVPLNARIANKDTSLPLGGGSDGQSPIFVRKGRIVIYQIYATHRRPDLWGANADDFKPERWESARPGFEYLPFNGGPRICLGQQFALVEASYTLIRLCQAFSNIEAKDGGGPWTEDMGLTCAVGQGVHVGLTKAT